MPAGCRTHRCQLWRENTDSNFFFLKNLREHLHGMDPSFLFACRLCWVGAGGCEVRSAIKGGGSSTVYYWTIGPSASFLMYRQVFCARALPAYSTLLLSENKVLGEFVRSGRYQAGDRHHRHHHRRRCTNLTSFPLPPILLSLSDHYLMMVFLLFRRERASDMIK